MINKKSLLVFLIFLAVLANGTLHAQAVKCTGPFGGTGGIGQPAQWAYIGNAGNPADGSSYYTYVNGANVYHTDPDQVGYGSVSYDFSVFDRFVRIGDYLQFLNAVDPTNTKNFEGELAIRGLIQHNGSSWVAMTYTGCGIQSLSPSVVAQCAVSYISLNQMARFANWVATGDPNTGAYTFSSTNGNANITSVNSSFTGPRLLTENEFYKAAYWNPSTNRYNLFGTTNLDGSGIPIQTNVTSSANQVSSSGHPYNLPYYDYPNGDPCLWQVRSGQGGQSSYGLYNLVGAFHNTFLPNNPSFPNTQAILRPENQVNPGEEGQRSSFRQVIAANAFYASPSFHLAKNGNACCSISIPAAPAVTQPTCAVPTGTIVITATGGGTLQYSVNGGTTWQASNTFSGLAPGSYNVRARVQNNTSCMATYPTAIVISAVPVAPVVSASTVTQPTCSVSTGTIVVNATGSGTLQYSIDGTTWVATNTFSGLAPGSYTPRVRLQSSTTCTTNGTAVTINALPTVPVVSASTVTQPTCALPTGTIVVNATGSGMLEYSINGGTTWVATNAFSGLAPGSYTPRVRLQNNTTCSTIGTAVTINAVPVVPVVAASTVTQPTCAVTTGTIIVNATGSGVLEYSINGGTTWVTTNSFTTLAPGNYTPIVRLQSSPTCSTTGTTATINPVPALPIVAASTVTQPTCAVSTGTIVVNATGNGVLEYSINGGTTWVTTNTFSGLAPGSYTVTVRLQSNPTCLATSTTSTINAVPVLPNINTAPTVVQPTCAVTTGTITINATGTSTLEYTIDNGATWSTNNTFTGLTPGTLTYYVQVRLQSSPTCVKIYAQNPVVINAVPTTPVVAASTVTQPTCAVTTGTIVVNATGSGTLEYSINGGTTWTTDNTFIALPSGSYTPKVRLQSSPTCSTNGTAVTINPLPTVPVVAASTVTQPTCAVSTGTIVANATGSGTLEYSINNGTTWVTTNTFSGLAPGSYTVRVRLQSNPTCSATSTTSTINAVPVLPNITTAPAVVQPTCGVPTGTITISATGTSTLEYTIDNGTTWSTNNTFTGLAPGTFTYYVQVRLQSSPTCVKIYAQNPVVINAVPATPVVSASTVTQPTCAVTSGTIVVNATGSGTLEYSINGGTTWTTSNTFIALPPGSYTPKARLQSSPTCSTNGTVVTISPVPSVPVIAASNVTQPTCAVSTGTIVANATGSGTLEYSINSGITWVSNNTFSGLAPGSYAVRVRLQNSPTCSATSTAATINAVPVLPNINTAPTVVQPTCAVTTGTITINATGTSTLEYTIDNGVTWSTNNTFTGLAPGTFTYYVQVRLQSSPTCVKIYAQNPVVINAVPPLPVITSAPVVAQPDCPTQTGSISVSATGTGVLEYSVNAGTTWQTSSSFNGLSAGNYNVYVRTQSNPTCVRMYSGNPIVLNPISCRDYTPTIEIDNVTFLSNSAARQFVINVSEVINGASAGQITLKIPKISGFTYTFSPTMTTASVNGGTAVSNNLWDKTENSLFITLTLKPGVVLNPFAISTVGLTVQRNSSVPTQTNQPMTVTIVDNSGGDTNKFNNTYNLVIKAQ